MRCFAAFGNADYADNINKLMLHADFHGFPKTVHQTTAYFYERVSRHQAVSMTFNIIHFAFYIKKQRNDSLLLHFEFYILHFTLKNNETTAHF